MKVMHAGILIITISIYFLSGNILCLSSDISDSQPNHLEKTRPSKEFLGAHDKMIEHSKKVYENLMTASTNSHLSAIVDDFGKQGVPEGLVTDLLPNLCNKAKCETSPNLSAQMGGQDVTFVGGRCAWMLQEILGCRFQKVTPNMSDAEREKIANKVLDRLDDIRNDDTTSISAKLKPLTVTQKIDLANNPNAIPRELHYLSLDSSPEVRKTAPSNLKTPSRDISRMCREDEDKEVRNEALKNLYHARTVSLSDVYGISDISTVTSRTFYFQVKPRK
jgi:hypothetical protein